MPRPMPPQKHGGRMRVWKPRLRTLAVLGLTAAFVACLALSAGASRPSSFRGHTDRVNQVIASADGKTLASASWYDPAKGWNDGTIRVWDVPGGRERATISDHSGRV